MKLQLQKRSIEMGFVKEEKVTRLIRAIKTVFFLITLLISFLFFSAPVLLAVADTILPSALLSASLSSSAFLSPQTLSAHFRDYDFRYSLIDIPLVSILRSLLIICKIQFHPPFFVLNFQLAGLWSSDFDWLWGFIIILCVGVYSCCDGPKLSRGPYLWVATVSSVVSLVYVSLKAPFVFGGGGADGGRGYAKSTEVALFVCSFVLAVGHVAVAYRTSCRERKKLLVYKIDIEAVSPSSLPPPVIVPCC